MRARTKSSGSSSRAASPAEAAPAPPPAGGLFDRLAKHDHEQLSLAYDPVAGYRGIIAIHNTTLGPALGGTRFWHYESDTEALTDVLRLSRAMTYKAAVAGLDLGGGKSVILGDPATAVREAIFRAHGRHVQSLGGRYITAEDVGTSPSDMELIRVETSYVVGTTHGSGDPSPVTAFGVYRGMKACAKYRWGSDALSGKTVAVQGLGHVGFHLCKYLQQEGAKLVVTDVDEKKVKRVVRELHAKAVAPDDIYGVKADIFAPCALGAVINDVTLKRLHVEIIAGGANNQLAEERHGDMVEARGLTYAPDYVINAGGLINVWSELKGRTREQAHDKAAEIYDTILSILTIAKEERIPSYRAAARLAQQRVAEAAASRRRPGKEL